MAPPQSDVLPVNIRESFYWSKWLTFSASALIMLCAGLSYSCEYLILDCTCKHNTDASSIKNP